MIPKLISPIYTVPNLRIIDHVTAVLVWLRQSTNGTTVQHFNLGMSE